MTTVLRALGWDHPRCVEPMAACSAVWEAQGGVRVEWDVRSLDAFGDEPIDQVAGRYDVLTIDHPHCGLAIATGSLTPLDELLPAAELQRLAADSLGSSYRSYTYRGRQVALPIDGACQVAAVRPDLLDRNPVPVTWTDVIDLARELPGRVALPLAPAHALSSFLTYSAAHGEDPASSSRQLVKPEVGVAAIEWLGLLACLGPSEAIAWEPPQLLERMTSTDTIVYAPLSYGYVTYARERANFRPCRFLDIPRDGGAPVGSVLGGVGLAVSSASRRPREAAAFAAWAADATTQRAIVAPAGGQPASRSAWLDPAVDRASGGFYSATLASVESAWVRPRDPWWPAFQVAAGRALTHYLRRPTGSAADTLLRLDGLYRSIRADARASVDTHRGEPNPIGREWS